MHIIYMRKLVRVYLTQQVSTNSRRLRSKRISKRKDISHLIRVNYLRDITMERIKAKSIDRELIPSKSFTWQ